MGFWTVLGGAATGVAVVVALRVAGGPIGASEEQAEKRSEERAKAEYAKRLEEIHSYMEAMQKDIKDWDRFGDQLIAMAAVGFACANCDGDIHPQELTEIDEFIAGANHSELPPRVKRRLNELRQEPPNLKTAFELAKTAKVKFSLLDNVIDVVMHADDRVHEKEKAFMNAWHKMKSA